MPRAEGEDLELRRSLSWGVPMWARVVALCVTRMKEVAAEAVGDRAGLTCTVLCISICICVVLVEGKDWWIG